MPLAAFMQDRSPPEHRGSILAASNFLTFGGMLLASGRLLAAAVAGKWHSNSTPREIFLLCGLATIRCYYISF